MCSNHRVIMVSSELVWDNKWCYGEPKEMIVKHRCLGDCKQDRETVFKLKEATKR